MQRALRAVLIVAGILVALFALAVIGLNLYVQSAGAQARIQQELSHRLGLPLKVQSVSITPWGGLTLSGISVPDTLKKGNFLEARAFEMHAALSSVFSGNFVIRKVSLVRPTVIWAQDQDGRWRLPGNEDSPSKSAIAQAAPLPVRPLPPALPSSQQNEAAAPSPPLAQSPSAEELPMPVEKSRVVREIVPDVRRAAIRNGSFRFLDKQGALIAAFEGVELQGSVDQAKSFQGVVNIERLSARDRFYLQKIRSPLKYLPDSVELSRISAHAAGGDVEGAFNVRPDEENSPFSLNLHFRKLKADDLVSDAGGNRGMITGEIDGNLEAAGNTSDDRTVTGKGDLVLRNGQLQQYSLFVTVGQVLQIDELTQLRLEQAEAKYHLQDGAVVIDEMTLRSPNLKVTATGRITLNGKLALNAQLGITEKIRNQLFRPIRENFQPTSDPQYSAVDFQVMGTLERPRTNLMGKVVGRDLKDIVSGFLGGKKSGKNRKNAQPDVSPTPLEAPSLPASPSPSSTP